jgi:hypothetical protein
MAGQKPPINNNLVHEMVAVAHGDLSRVTELVQQEPTLVNAAWDWGGGDWETALGASAHVGRRDIAEFLLARGARIDLFAAAMLGKLEIVKATLTAFPDALHIPGPHGIPLVVHAEMGGAAAQPVLEYLQSLR